MTLYLINTLNKDGFGVIITLLDYQTQISKCLNFIKMSPSESGKILIDTILCSGMNEYRFIEAALNEDGTINLDQYKYITVNNDILEKANEIVKHQRVFLENSVLPESQIEKVAPKEI